MCVCDFDVAVELGEDDEMLPISQSNEAIAISTFMQSINSIWVCVLMFDHNQCTVVLNV